MKLSKETFKNWETAELKDRYNKLTLCELRGANTINDYYDLKLVSDELRRRGFRIEYGMLLKIALGHQN